MDQTNSSSHAFQRWMEIPTEGSRIAVIDDDLGACDVLTQFYKDSGYSTQSFHSAQDALAFLSNTKGPQASCPFDLILCDLHMPSIDGLELIEQVKKLFTAPPPIILVTAHATVQSAVDGLAHGAFDYITKPVDFKELAVISQRAIKIHKMQRNYFSVKKELTRAWTLEDIVGKSPQMQRIFELINRLSEVSCNVLIAGESGTGKEMVARAIHFLGARAKKQFVAINCTAIPENLLESELFGHARGSFTGATEKRRGLFEEAHEGTIFLDEIGDMPLALQAKLLRFLQERKIKPIGENTYRSVDVRIIAATHRDLKVLVQEGKFREDLYYRLCVASIALPPLRERREDIPVLAEHFIEKLSKKTDSRVKGFTKSAQAKLMRLPWFGNVRELENAIERAAVFCQGSIIEEYDIEGVDLSSSGSKTGEMFSGLVPLDEMEKQYIQYVLSQTGNVKEKAAEILRIDRKTLYRKQKEMREKAAGGSSVNN